MARTERGLRQATRWGLLGVALLSAAGIIVSTALGYLEARALAPPLARGQAEAFIRTLRERARPELGAPGPQILQGLLDRHAADGLRYVALLDRGGRVLAAAGEPLAGGRASVPAPGELLSGPGWVRVLAPPPPPPGP
ncbi:MAG: hypothetical protein HY744_01595, partial [Deltaproteobacteria bacterium]|nr:hypothetical protein [Deltaproteobacteria bacterium]